MTPVEKLFADSHTFGWAIAFIAVYVVAQLLVSYHPRFKAMEPIKKSISVKLIALGTFVLLYLVAIVFR